MKKLLFIFLLACLPVFAQGSGTGGGGGNTIISNFAGAPTGSCTVINVAENTINGDFYDCVAGTWTKVSSGGSSGNISGLTLGFIPKAGSATTITANSAMDDGITTSSQITSTEPINAPTLSTGAAPPTACGTAIGCIALGEASGAATPTAGMDTIRASSTNHSFVCSFNGSAEGACNGAQYAKRVCPFEFGDGVNAIVAATYPASGAILQCVNNSGVTWTVTGIHCFTDNAGTSTVQVSNNAGTALLTGAVTCNATKTSGGAAGTQSATTTIATTDGLNFVFVADGTTKYATVTVDFTF